MAWSTADELRFCIRMGLRKGLALVRGMRRALTEEEQDRVAGEIAADLQRGWKIEPIPPPIGGGYSGFAQKKEEKGLRNHRRTMRLSISAPSGRPQSRRGGGEPGCRVSTEALLEGGYRD
jgi:hypothetical protein